ncbi:MAG: hypothetical protein GY816_04445 [Cytophagales bacterium]|nr:hypothetical protein [Cytophagales bacterium]
MTEPKHVFKENIRQYQDKFELLDKKDKQLSILRFSLFTICIILLVYTANDRSGALFALTLTVFLVVFGWLIRVHNNVKFKSKLSFFKRDFNSEELRRTKGDFTGLNQGDSYFDKDHPFAPDLDIFGSNSLFQLITRSRLLLTQKLSAKWMLKPADQKTILDRQEAIKELSGKIEWRQQFTAYGMYAEHTQTEDQLRSFEKWMSDRNDFVEKPFWIVINWVMPLLSLVLLIGISFFGLRYQIIFIPILLNAYILKVTFSPLMKLTKDFDKATKSLKMYARLFASIESNKFESTRLVELKNRLLSNNILASKSVSKLSTILDQLQNRANMLYFPLNVLFVLDLFWLRQGENWKRKNREAAKNWFASVHEFDMLSDMASYAYANPDYCYPKILEEDFILKSEELGHPLIPNAIRVANSFEFGTRGFVGLITGSNMSGKSTFLRTVGLNLTMAQMGLPVCAKSFSFSLTRLFTGMRTTDNLEESVSSFYAELSRIKSLLDSIDEKEPTLYLLDEILKGTNSEDRHKGSISLIRQLNEKNTFGLISTHDLTLSSLENEASLIRNYSFNSTIEGDEILFDYKLSDGPCRSFNASKLMEKMGIILEKE